MTLRLVTHEAKVNLAAVNYHFGSKLNLMRALLRDRFEPINQQRHRLLDQQIEAHAPDPVPLPVIYDTLFRPTIYWHWFHYQQRQQPHTNYRPCPN